MSSLQGSGLESQLQDSSGSPTMQVVSLERPQVPQTWENMLKERNEHYNMVLRRWEEENPTDGSGERSAFWGQEEYKLWDFLSLKFPERFAWEGQLTPPVQFPLDQQRRAGDPRMVGFYPSSLWLSRDEAINRAFKALDIQGIDVVEYGGQLLHRLGCQDPEEVSRYEAENKGEYHMQVSLTLYRNPL